MTPASSALRQPILLLLAGLLTAGTVVAAIVWMIDRDLDSQNRLVNVSLRGPAGTGPEAMLVGFVVADRPQLLVVRALGPSLARPGAPAAVARPILRVVRNADGVDVARSTGWQMPGNERLSGDLKHFAPARPEEPACVVRLVPGGYSVLVESGDGRPGLASIEIFTVRH